MTSVNIILLVNYIINILSDKYFTTVFEYLSLMWQCAEHCDFLNIDISQGSVATYVRCSGIYKYAFVANLPLSMSVKKILKIS